MTPAAQSGASPIPGRRSAPNCQPTNHNRWRFMAQTKKARAIGFNHVALEVGDIDEALTFYGRLFEFELRGRSKTSAFIDLGDQFLALQKGRTQSTDPRFEPARHSRGARSQMVRFVCRELPPNSRYVGCSAPFIAGKLRRAIGSKRSGQRPKGDVHARMLTTSRIVCTSSALTWACPVPESNNIPNLPCSFDVYSRNRIRTGGA